jgi:hypothetical protein
MANNLITISKVTNLALMILENELTFASEVNRDYDDQFAVSGAKIGNTVNVRRPGRFLGTTGPALNVEDFNETSIPVVLTTQFHVDCQFITQDMALSMDLFGDRVLKPAIAAVANRVDRDGLLMAKNNTANIVGVPGTRPTGLLTYLTAASYLDSEGAPRDGRRAVVLEPFTSSVIVDSLKGLFTPSDKIGEQYEKGLLGRDAGGVNWKLDQNVATHQFGAWTTTAGTLTANTTGAFTGSLATGWAQTSTITLTNSTGITLNQGDTIQIAGVYAVNPQNRQIYGGGVLRSFVVTQSVTAASGSFAVTVSPAIITGGQFQNVSVTSTSSTATVTPLSVGTSAAGTLSPQNIMFHRNAYTLAVADLPVPEGVDFAGRASDEETGLSLRIVRQYTINNDALPTRIEILYGWAPLYQELGCRIAS